MSPGFVVFWTASLLLFCLNYGFAAERKVVVGGDRIERILSADNQKLRTTQIVNKIADRTLKTTGQEFVITYGDDEKITSDDFNLIAINSTANGTIATLKNNPLNLQAQISYTTADQQPWLYKQITFTNTGQSPFLLRTVEIEHLKIENEEITYSTDRDFPYISNWGQPVYTESLWFGVEFPATRSSATSDGFIFLRHHPGIELAPKQTYQTKRAVLGASALGKLDKTFMDYVRTLPQREDVPQMNNCWVGFLVIRPPDRTSKGLKMIEYVKKIKDQTGFTFGGWSYDAGLRPRMYRNEGLFVPHEEGIWQKTAEALKQIDTPLGFWCSFSGKYDADTTAWGRKQGFEVVDIGKKNYCYCLAGPNYSAAIKKRLEDIVRKYNVGWVDFDGMTWGAGFGCNQPDHGHLVGQDAEAGVYACERVVENKFKIFGSLRQINPDIVLNLLICSGWASPWWLIHVDGVHTVGDDTRAAGIPSPWLRDELITARDIQVFDIHRRRNLKFPLWAENLYGTQVRRDHLINFIKVNGEDYAQRWEDEYVMAMPARGAISLHMLCADLEVLDRSKPGLKFVGQVANWTRANQSIYHDYHLIGGEPKNRDVFGYSHCDEKGRAVIGLRNPYIISKTFGLTIDKSINFQPTDEKIYVNIIYPYRKTFEPVDYGQTIYIPIQDYQVMMLDVRTQSRQFKNITPSRWSVTDSGQLITYSEYPLRKAPSGYLRAFTAIDALHLKGEINVPKSAKTGQIQIMFEFVEGKKITKPKVLLDGKETDIEFHQRQNEASCKWKVEQDWALVNTPNGRHKIDVIIEDKGPGNIKVSAWLIANYRLKPSVTDRKVPDAERLFPVISADEDRKMTTILEPVKCRLP